MCSIFVKNCQNFLNNSHNYRKHAIYFLNFSSLKVSEKIVKISSIKKNKSKFFVRSIIRYAKQGKITLHFYAGLGHKIRKSYFLVGFSQVKKKKKSPTKWPVTPPLSPIFYSQDVAFLRHF